MRYAIYATILGGLAIGTASPIAAAVRSCLPPIAGEIVQADTEPEGKRKALESWTAKVARAGPGFMRWQLAVQRSLVCRPVRSPGTKGFACVASAAPCTIQQAPGQPGAGGKSDKPVVPGVPRRRLIPPGRNVPFEV